MGCKGAPQVGRDRNGGREGASTLSSQLAQAAVSHWGYRWVTVGVIGGATPSFSQGSEMGIRFYDWYCLKTAHRLHSCNNGVLTKHASCNPKLSGLNSRMSR